MLDTGALLERIKNFAHFLHDSQTESCTVNIVAEVLCNQAGACVMDLKLYNKIRTVCEVPKYVVEQELPCLAGSTKHIDEKYEERNGKKQNKSNFLKSVQRCLLAIDGMIRHFVKMSTSLKVEEDRIIRLFNLTIHKRHKHSAFSHGLFRLELCLKFAANVRVVEE